MDNKDRIEKYADGRPTFEWPNGMTEHAVDEEFIASVARHVVQKHPSLYSFDGELKQLRRGKKGLYLKSFGREDKRVFIKDAVYIHESADGDYAAITSPRAWFKNAVFDEVTRQVPVCKGIVTHPVVTSSGDVVVKRGYNAETSLYVDTSSEMKKLPRFRLYDRESVTLAQNALRRVHGHKTFYSYADESRYVAVLLTAMMAPCYDVAPPVYANNTSADSIEARTLFYELDKILHGRATSSDYLGIDKCVVQRKDISSMREGKGLPIFLAYSDQNQTPDWLCYVDSGMAIRVIFDDSRDNAIKEIAKEFELFRMRTFDHLFILIRAWYKAGKPAPTTPSAFDPIFDEWYYHVAGVLEHAGYTSISDNIVL